MAERDSEMSVNEKESVVRNDGLGSYWCWWRRRRLILVVLSFLGYLNLYIVRVNLSVAIVDMTANRSVLMENGTVTMQQDFTWNSGMKGLILSAFFYGYTATQLLGGWLAIRFGAALIMGISVTGASMVSIVTPQLASSSVYLLIASRIIQGLLQGLVMAASQVLWINWAPQTERARLTTANLSGCNAGLVLGLPLSGFIATTLGWPSIFYICGGSGIVWGIIWVLIARGKPEHDKGISSMELKYIRQNDTSKAADVVVSHPWFDIFTSIPMWVTIAAHFACNWSLYTMLTHLPSFIKDTFDFNLEDTGFISALPYLANTVCLMLGGHISDYLQSKEWLSRTNLRKLFMGGGLICQTFFLLLVTCLTDTTLIIICLTAGASLGAFCYTAICVIFMDMAPSHCGVLLGISATIANLSGIISPALTGFIVTNKSFDEWRVVFYIASGLLATASLMFLSFATAEKQSWSEKSTKTECKSTADNVNKDELTSKL